MKKVYHCYAPKCDDVTLESVIEVTNRASKRGKGMKTARTDISRMCQPSQADTLHAISFMHGAIALRLLERPQYQPLLEEFHDIYDAFWQYIIWMHHNSFPSGYPFLQHHPSVLTSLHGILEDLYLALKFGEFTPATLSLTIEACCQDMDSLVAAMIELPPLGNYEFPHA